MDRTPLKELNVWRLAVRIAVLWSLIFAAELAFHWYIGSGTAGSDFAFFFYNTEHGVGLADIFGPVIAVGVCLGYWLLSAGGRLITLCVVLNMAVLILMQRLWLTTVLRPPGWDHWYGPAFLIEEAIFGTIVMTGSLLGVRQYNRRWYNPSDTSERAAGGSGPSAS